MGFGALSTLLGQLPMIATTITNCVLMSKMTNALKNSGGYNFFGTSNTTNQYVGLDWFQPKYSNIEDDKSKTPIAPINYDRVYDGYSELAKDATINDYFSDLDKKVNDGDVTITLGTNNKWSKETMKSINELGNNCKEISSHTFKQSGYVTDVQKAAAKVVKEYDRDNDGVISFDEYKTKKLKNVADDKRAAIEEAAKEMFDKLDFDGSENIGHEEMASYLAYLDQGLYDNADKSSISQSEDIKGSRNGKITDAEYILNSESFIMDTKESARATLKANWNLLFGEAATKARRPRP